MRHACMILVTLGATACTTPVAIGDQASPVTTGPDAATDAAPQPGAARSKIEHVVIIVQENHTFDSYFGRYCTAPTGSNPTCTGGPGCCEAAPATIAPNDTGPAVIDDALNAKRDPDHTQACELAEMNGGAMDRYVAGPTCASPDNFAIAAQGGPVQPYFDYAAQYAMADRYFQPLVGQSSSNDMYLAVAKFVFADNAFEPAATGHGCSDPFAQTTTYTQQTTIADLLIDASATFGSYAQGFDAMYASNLCPLAPADCAMHVPTLPCVYDPGDVPFEYYSQFQNNHAYMKDYDDDFPTALAGAALPAVSFVKAVMYKNEHPGYGDTVSQGVAFVQGVVNAVLASNYASSTLVLVTWDEGGGFYDHVAPPAPSAVDMQPYGTRVPLLAIGPFARQNFVSHVVMEHSSILKFIEWNFLGATGQLAARDAVVNNIGSLLDPAATGAPVPEN